ncbi:MAG: hypothetical protein WAM04_10265, partial [Candidatus Sulfotelmatobacter sp.]
AVVHDLAINLAGCEVDETQGFPQKRGLHTLPRAKISLWGLGAFISQARDGKQVTQVTPGWEVSERFQEDAIA